MRKVKLLMISSIISIGLFGTPMISSAEEKDIYSLEDDTEYTLQTDTEKVNEYGEIISDEENDLLDCVEEEEGLTTASGDVQESGKAGDDATWELKDGVLTISGTGETYSNIYNDAGWYGYRASIEKIVVSEGITRLGYGSFQNCSNLKEVILPTTLTAFDNALFRECTSLEKIDIPDLVTDIPTVAFYGCSSLKEVNAKNIQTIGISAFSDTNLDIFFISKNITSIGACAFSGAPIKEFIVDEENAFYESKDGVLFADGGKTILAYPIAKEDSSYTVPSDVTKILNAAFYKAENLKSIDLANVESMCLSTFRESAIENLVLPDTLVYVEDQTFSDCNKLRSVKFGNGLKSTARYMFEGCTSLKEIDFGTGLESLDGLSFSYCESLEEITLPENITSIGSGCFGECTSLKTVNIKNLSTISYQAFLNCDNLETVKMNEGVININRLAFQGCPKLKSVNLPSTVEYVASLAFSKDTELIVNNPKLDAFGVYGYRYLEPINITGTRNYTNAYEVLDIINEERAKVGVAPLELNEELMEAAMVRAAETSILFDHVRPNSLSCFRASSLMYGENIACGQNSPESVMESWMNSSGHKENILNKDYKTVGIGCFEIDGTVYWTQCFGIGEAEGNTEKIADKVVTETIDIAVGEFSQEQEHGNIVWGNSEKYTYSMIVEAATEMNAGSTDVAKTYIINPGNRYKTLIDNDCLNWSSSDEKRATVEKGSISCLSDDNSVEIICQTKDGGYKASCMINDHIWEKFAENDGYTFTIDKDGNIRCFDSNRKPVIDEFMCDGTFTYYFQFDGTAMRDRLTYHPDGTHIIYFDKEGHEVFSDFANVKKSIAGDAVDDLCFFNVYGYMYVDTLTYDKSGTKLYYVNPYGVIERNGWFAFSGHEFEAGLGFEGRSGGYGYANNDGSLMTNCHTYDWDANFVYIQGDGHMFR